MVLAVALHIVDPLELGNVVLRREHVVSRPDVVLRARVTEAEELVRREVGDHVGEVGDAVAGVRSLFGEEFGRSVVADTGRAVCVLVQTDE